MAVIAAPVRGIGSTLPSKNAATINGPVVTSDIKHVLKNAASMRVTSRIYPAPYVYSLIPETPPAAPVGSPI